MNIEKYMVETTKALLKEKNKVMFWNYEDSFVISNDGYFAIVVPREKFIFNAESLGTFTGKLSPNWECHEMRYTNNCEQYGKKLFRVLESVSGKWKTLIDEKFLKYFDMNTNIKFYQSYEKAAVVVTEFGKLCAIIMPFVKKKLNVEI